MENKQKEMQQIREFFYCSYDKIAFCKKSFQYIMILVIIHAQSFHLKSAGYTVELAPH